MLFFGVACRYGVRTLLPLRTGAIRNAVGVVLSLWLDPRFYSEAISPRTVLNVCLVAADVSPLRSGTKPTTENWSRLTSGCYSKRSGKRGAREPQFKFDFQFEAHCFRSKHLRSEFYFRTADIGSGISAPQVPRDFRFELCFHLTITNGCPKYFKSQSAQARVTARFWDVRSGIPLRQPCKTPLWPKWV
jgi:hypothetical protein